MGFSELRFFIFDFLSSAISRNVSFGMNQSAGRLLMAELFPESICHELASGFAVLSFYRHRNWLPFWKPFFFGSSFQRLWFFGIYYRYPRS